MTTRRFQVTPVNEFNRNNVSFQPSEIIPLIDIKQDVPPPPPPPPTSFTSVTETHKPSIRLVNSFIHRLKTSSSTADLRQKNEISHLPTNHSNSMANLNVNKDIEEPDSCNSTMHTMDTNSLRQTNKFLHELRLKRRELCGKAHNLSIDQRIALHRFQRDREIMRAQDIFDVHFASNDEENMNMPEDFFNETAQERIRKNIFNELDRQRIKQFHKHHRQLLVGRVLLMVVISVILLMSITLIYVVMDLYDRANYLDLQLEDNEFLAMIYDDATDV